MQPPEHPTRDTDNEDHRLAKKIKNFIYNPHDMIGSGFSSEVFRGINENNLQPIAIKVIELNKIQNEVQKYLLNNQITALRSVHHKNVLHTIDILMTKNNVYIVTQYCEDGDLFKIVEKARLQKEKESRQGQPAVISEWDALSIVRDILEGYRAIEDKGILHRDLKTANIFMSKGVAKIADFGFCEVQQESSKKPQIAYNVGSPAYMSPESYRDNQYSSKSDIWSIGIILYEMLLGETPDKTQTYDIMVNNLTLGRISCGSNEDIKAILTKSFKKNLNERFDSRGMLDAINAELRKMQSKNGFTGSVIVNKTAVVNPSVIQTRHSQFIHPSQNNQSIPHQQSNAVKSSSPVTHKQTYPHNLQGPGSLKTLQRHGVYHHDEAKQRYSTHNPVQTAGPFNTKLEGFRKNSFETSEQQIHHHQFHSNQSQTSAQFFGHKKTKSKSPDVIHLSASGSKMSRTEQTPATILKPSIQMLLFLYRLLKLVSQTSLQEAQMTRLILFRHRSLIDQSLPGTSVSDESYRQFQYLKSRFDETYIQKEFNHNPSHKTMVLLNQLTNAQFTHPDIIKAYQGIFQEACQACEAYIFGKGKIDESTIDFNKIGSMWDYLMLEQEILRMIAEGKPVNEMIETMDLGKIVKEQPKKMLHTHYELLRAKNRMIAASNAKSLGGKSSDRSSRKSLGLAIDTPVRDYEVHENRMFDRSHR